MRAIGARLLAFLIVGSMALSSGCRPAATVRFRTPGDRVAPFTVVHRPPMGQPLPHPPFRYMHYYRTEVKNVSDHPVKIVWFEAYRENGGTWYPGNVLGRALRADEFSAWYTEGDPIAHGVIPAGRTAACDVNWYGSNSPGTFRSKWAYIAVDTSGNDYYVEAEVEPSVVKVVDHNAGH